jgi:hypothetical protein
LFAPGIPAIILWVSVVTPFSSASFFIGKILFEKINKNSIRHWSLVIINKDIMWCLNSVLGCRVNQWRMCVPNGIDNVFFWINYVEKCTRGATREEKWRLLVSPLAAPSKQVLRAVHSVDQLQLVPLGGDTGPRRPALNWKFL